MDKDPFLARRIETAKKHRVLGTVELGPSAIEVEVKKGLPNPVLEASIEDLGWSDKAVSNIIEAVSKGWIRLTVSPDETVRVEFLPIQLPLEELGHVVEIDPLKKNLARKDGLFGDPDLAKMTYLQTTDFAVEGYLDDESNGARYGRLYVDATELAKYRDVYLDPESLHITDYEFGYAFAVFGGMPFKAVKRIELIQARKVPIERSQFVDDFPEIDLDAELEKQARRLREFVQPFRQKEAA